MLVRIFEGPRSIGKLRGYVLGGLQVFGTYIINFFSEVSKSSGVSRALCKCLIGGMKVFEIYRLLDASP